MNERVDAVIIGGGHNGLITAGYLARAGLKVMVLERRAVLGGACVTEEVWPGFKVSTLSYLCSLLQKQIVDDLELKRYGYYIYPKDPSFFTAFPDGRHIFFWQDGKKTYDEIARFSKHDAEAYGRYEAELEEIAIWVESLLMKTPPNIIRRKVQDLIEMAKLGLRTFKMGDDGLTRLVKIMTQSGRDFLNERFESEEIKTTLATDAVIGTNGGPSTPGTAYILLHHVMGDAAGQRGLWGFIRGGMGGISNALAQSAQAHGTVIRTLARVQRILIKNGVACGVVLEGGEEIYARMVVSNADPKTTFIRLIDAKDIDADFRGQIDHFRSEGASLKINLALDGLPNFKAYPTNGLGLPHKTTMHICPSMDYIDAAWRDATQGRPSENPMLECTIPTAYDDSIAPSGKHIMSMFVQYAPYSLKNLKWDNALKEKFANRCLDVMAEYAPNIKEIVLHRQVISPLDLEQEYGLTGGNLFHGDMNLDQFFCMRPVPGWAQYRTPVNNLYLCGSGTHPGGGVMGAPGHNAAREILRDLRRGKLVESRGEPALAGRS